MVLIKKAFGPKLANRYAILAASAESVYKMHSVPVTVVKF
jgi:hypothetical protein